MEAYKNILKTSCSAILSNTKVDGFTIEPLAGDASSRRYFRICHTSGQEKSFVLVLGDKFLPQENSFLRIQDLLSSNGVNVPTILAVLEEEGAILQEDLGGTNMLQAMSTSPMMTSSEIFHFFQKPLDLMFRIHGAKPKNKNQEKAFLRAFDEKLFLWEVNFTIEHFFTKYLGRKMKEQDRNSIYEDFRNICGHLLKEPQVFVHRDFHTKNIMFTEDKRYVSIDFQDGCMGPPHYDLASLLRDSYYSLSEENVYKLLEYYMDLWDTSEKLDRVHCRRIFDLMSIQRNFKAIGSFASFYTRRGDIRYLHFIGNTFQNVQTNLTKFPEYKNLQELLLHYYHL